jgi:hypothetical protein
MATNSAEDIRTEKVFVTPKKAAEWLAANTRNRSPSPAHVSTLERVMERGEWVLNGDAIRFGADGILQDGQHRLMACVNTGVGFWTLVVFGLSPAAFDTIDGNLKTRKVSDVLSRHDLPNYCTLSPCVKHVWAFGKYGQFYDGGMPHNGFSAKVCMEVIERRPLLQAVVARVCSGSGLRVFPSMALLSALGYVFSCADPALAGEFLSVMESGSSEMERPFNVFRESLINRRITKARVGIRPMSFMAIRAWNSEMNRVWVKKFYYKPNESFPEIAGLDYEKLDEIA